MAPVCNAEIGDLGLQCLALVAISNSSECHPQAEYRIIVLRGKVVSFSERELQRVWIDVQVVCE
jgi:hypothetical protein